ncbi:MAG: cytidine deaminase [Candidatus Paceibacterota bacterium]|jgi:cytidine deaminase
MKSEQELIEVAREAAKNAHIPYFDFPVGAVIETESGELFTGCNIDNASTPLGICAERTAIFNAINHGHKDIKRIVVTCIKGDKSKPETLMPCGACRQVMAEFMSPEAEIIVDGVRTFKLKELLPSPFTLK